MRFCIFPCRSSSPSALVFLPHHCVITAYRHPQCPPPALDVPFRPLFLTVPYHYCTRVLFSALLHDDDICDPKAFPHSPFCMQLVDIIASLPGEAGQCLQCCTVFSAVCEGGILVLCAALQLRIEFRTLSYVFVVGSSLRDWLLWHLPLLSRVPVMFAGSYLPCQATRGSCFDVGRVDRKILNQQFL